MSAYLLDVAELYFQLDTKRVRHALTWRQLGRLLDIAPSTFSRMRSGDKRPDADALVTMLYWLELDAAQVTRYRTER